MVTGASRGIGRAIAEQLAARGATVALLARDAAALDTAVAAIAGAGGIGRAYPCDVTDSGAVARVVAAIARDLPPVRVLVNNAGSVLRSATVEITDAEWRGVFATNVDGTFFVTRAVLPHLTAGSRIINIASRAGREGTIMLAGYCAAKHAVVGFTRSLAEELRAAKVSVNAVCPGSVDTEMLRAGIPGAVPAMMPADVAGAVAYLASPPPVGAPEALTGSCIDIFG